MWDPHRSVEDVVDEYARTWFGPEAAAPMAKAIIQIEDNIQDDPKTPLISSPGHGFSPRAFLTVPLVRQ
jgi:hypothetical protein